MPGDRIDGFDFAEKAGQRAGVEQRQLRIVEALLKRGGIDDQAAVGAPAEGAWLSIGDRFVHR